MRIESFLASADIVGRRVKVSWDVVLDPGEQVGAVPQLTLRAKQRDFEFPPAGDFVVYDSASFPPAGTTVTDIDLGGALLAGGGRAVTSAESVARAGAGGPVEVLRRTRTTTLRPDGTPASRHEEVLDVGPDGSGRQPRTPYYYELIVAPGADTPGWATRRPRAIATPTAAYGSGRALYEQLPAIYRRHDVVTAPPGLDTGSIPEAVAVNGQLRRLMDAFGAGLDHLRGRAEGLLDLRDVDTIDARLLPHLAAWLGWNLSHDVPIPLQRHEIRYAAYLYRITGTLPGCAVWAKRLTGWDTQVREMWRSVLVTNDLGNPDEPTDKGSRTLDTSNPAALGAIGTMDDPFDYTYDTSPDGLHSFTVIAFYATPEASEVLGDVVARRGRLLGGADSFLPFNLRAAVVLGVPVDEGAQTSALDLTATMSEGV
jgi:hypothetical protein